MTAEPPSSGKRLPLGMMVAGSEMASSTIIGLLLDYAFETMPGFTIGLTLLGLCVAFYHLVRMSKALTAKNPPGEQAGTGEDAP